MADKTFLKGYVLEALTLRGPSTVTEIAKHI